MSSQGYPLFCMGNPLLDMLVPQGEALLEKYTSKPTTPSSPKRSTCRYPSYEELVSKYSDKLTYVPGGAAQNAARGAASVVYTGSVGSDAFAEQLVAANQRAGLDQVYYVADGAKTGTCAVVVTGHHRSLVTYLGAAEKFDQAHLSSPAVAPLVDAAKVFYSALEVAKKASEAGKIFVLNLSAPFIPQFFAVQLQSIMPYVDIIIGNEAEAEAWASASGLADKTDLAAATTVIVDTNGAGDAFAGGLLAGLVLGKPIEECVEMGHKMGSMCVQQVGAQYKWPKVQIL
ncbi:Ribokinase-like protein [Epithele typhae]|uniref:Ribokinase-like protein n=1 Tax=Epithele typhae TaxID=378194 RepID=UPI002008D374|nr:Ribokinase-like protein [Epithele typhae]KAH9923184.1 Ribokinase-like protein [Epithele typhae]